MEILFKQISDNNKDRIYRICRAYSESTMDCEDLFQEVMLQIWKSLPAFRNESSINTWVFRITLNICMRTKFKHDKRKDVFSRTDVTTIDVHDPKTNENEYENLFYCIQRLNDIDRSIILLFLESQSYKEISEICGLTENHVAVRMNRMKQKLFTCIKAVS